MVSHGSIAYSKRRRKRVRQNILQSSTLSVQRANEYYKITGMTDALMSNYDEILVRISLGAAGGAGIRDFRFEYKLFDELSLHRVGDPPQKAISGGYVDLNNEFVFVYFGKGFRSIQDTEITLLLALDEPKNIVIAAYGIRF